MKLNHCANRITEGSLELMQSLFTEELGFRVLRRKSTDIWLRQGDSNIDIQFSETQTPPLGSDKHNSHISFLSETPEADLRSLADWLGKRGYEAKIGSWSDREFYLDVPNVFVDFAIEAMLPELADYNVVAVLETR